MSKIIVYKSIVLFLLSFCLSVVLWGVPVYAHDILLGEVIEEVEASVVCVIAVGADGYSFQSTGFIIDSEGYVLTTAHSLSVSSIEAVVVCWVPKDELVIFSAEIIAINNELDLAILDLDGNNFPALEIDTSASSVVGDGVIFVGFPATDLLGYRSPTVSRGIISNLTLSESGVAYISTDATLGLGGSGGPLYSLNTGNVVGVARAMGREGLGGLNFATPIEHIFIWSGTSPELGVMTAIRHIKICGRMVNLLE